MHNLFRFKVNVKLKVKELHFMFINEIKKLNFIFTKK